MKTMPLTSPRVEPQGREARQPRRAQDEFLTRGLRSSAEAKDTGVVHQASAVHAERQQRLDARRKRVRG